MSEAPPPDPSKVSPGARVEERFYRGAISPLQGNVSDALGITAPVRPFALVTSGIALA